MRKEAGFVALAREVRQILKEHDRLPNGVA